MCVCVCVCVCVENRVRMMIELEKKNKKNTHRFYVVGQCAYIHYNDNLNFSLYPNRVTWEDIYNNLGGQQIVSSILIYFHVSYAALLI